jgi:hypothetical protein
MQASRNMLQHNLAFIEAGFPLCDAMKGHFCVY